MTPSTAAKCVSKRSRRDHPQDYARPGISRQPRSSSSNQRRGRPPAPTYLAPVVTGYGSRHIRVACDRLTQIRDDKNEAAAKLRQEHRLLKTDRDYLENVARDRLALQRDGEYIIRIDREVKE